MSGSHHHHQHSLCSRFNTEVESTLKDPMKERPMHSLGKCPNGSTSTAMCHHAMPFAYPPWVVEAEEQNKKFMTEVIKCNGR